MIPTLSQITTYNPTHLISAAQHWDTTAEHWELTFAQVRSEAMGLNFSGATADALHTRTHTDHMTAITSASALREAANAASQAADELRTTQQRILNLVQDAQANNFTVTDDYSVTDQQGPGPQQATRYAAAITFSADLRRYAAELYAHDSKTSQNIAKAGIQLVDNQICNDPDYTNGIQRRLLTAIAGGALMGGLAGGVVTGGPGAVPGAIIGGGSAGIVDILHEISGDGPNCQ